MEKKENRRYKAVIFDFDGTLVNSLPYHFLSFKDLLHEHGIVVTDAHLRTLIGYSTERILKELQERYKFREKIDDLLEERRYHYFKFLGRKNIVFPGVIKTVEKLKKQYKLAIATGSSEVVVIHSCSKELYGQFDLISTINDVRHGKPHPEQLLSIAKKLRVRPQECLMVGDSIYDGLAAKAAGMEFIGVTTGYTSARALKGVGAVSVVPSIKTILAHL